MFVINKLIEMLKTLDFKQNQISQTVLFLNRILQNSYST